MTRLETERLVLVPLGREHEAAYAEIFEDTAELDRAIEHRAEHGFGHWAILDRSSGQLLGTLEVHYAGDGIGGIGPDEVEIGWTVTPARRREGIATEAARAAIARAFATLDAPHLVAYIRPENEASLRVAARLGMRPDGEGTTRSGDSMLIFRLPRPTTIDGRP